LFAYVCCSCSFSFPDTLGQQNADIIFSFRYPATLVTPSGPAHADPAVREKRLVDHFQYGFVFFRQKKDPAAKRGWLQRSLVVLTDHPYLSLWKPLLQQMGPSFFDVGLSILEEAVTAIMAW
jgi:hypothetical protein